MPDYTFNYFIFNNSDSTDPVGVNSTEITGYTSNDGSFIYSGGAFSPFSVPFQLAHITVAEAVNSKGDITGSWKSYSFITSGFVDIGGTFTSFAVPGATSTSPFGINDTDQISGSYDDVSGNHHGFIYDFTASTNPFTLIDVAGATSTIVRGINNSGDVVGDYTDSNGITHGFEYSNGSYHMLDVPGASQTLASGINDAGDIVGTYNDSHGEFGFIYSNGTFTTLVDPDNPATTHLLPNNIDDVGDIVGMAYDSLTGTGSGFEASIACYGRGTLIETDSGDRTVETLAIGDRVLTASGALRPIKWIGHRSYCGPFITGNKNVLPVCLKAGSLGEGVPRRHLWISPHHAMYLDGVLIEAKDLVNGVSIVQAEQVEEVEYFHIELDSHDVILAEGAASETFVDDDSRGMFHNAGEFAKLYPDAARRPARYCAPRLDQGFQLETLRRRIVEATLAVSKPAGLRAA